MRVIKAKRCLRRVPRAALARFIEPIFNAGQILTFCASVIGLALYLRLGATPEQRDVLASEWAIAIEAFALALIGWAILSIVIAPILVIRDDRRRGHWHDRRFLYHEPLLVTVIRCRATGAVERYPIRFPDAEPDSIAHYVVTLTPDVSHLANYAVGHVLVLGGRAQGRGSSRLEGLDSVFYIEMPEEAVSTSARIYCESFSIGDKLYDKDGKPGSIGPEIRRTPDGYFVGEA